MLTLAGENFSINRTQSSEYQTIGIHQNATTAVNRQMTANGKN
jgi:hypothetical protein